VRLALRMGFMIVALVALVTPSAVVSGPPQVIQFGRILDATDKPLPRVRVVGVYTGWPSRGISPGVSEAMTDSVGEYVLSLRGQAWVVYTAAGYESIRLVYPDELVECDSCCGRLKDIRLKR